MTKHEALAIVASLCADGVLDEKEEALLRKALAFPQRKPLDEREREWILSVCPTPHHIIKAVEAAHGIKENP